MPVPLTIRFAAILWLVTAVGFGIFCVPAIRALLSGRDIPYVMGFPAYGRGPFERIGIQTTVPLLVGFLLVCVLEGVGGWLLWSGRLSGAILELVLLPFGAVYWWGFALPIPPAFGAIATGLTVVSWGSLR